MEASAASALPGSDRRRTNGHGPQRRAPERRDPAERANTATAAVGLAAAGIAAVVLVVAGARQADGWRFAAALVFAASLVALHLASTLYHGATAPARKARLKLLDHCAIYVLIAGTYTPFTLIGLRGRLGWTLFAAIWSLAALGLLFKGLTFKGLLFATPGQGRLRLLSTAIYVAMGWLVLVAIRPVLGALDGWTFGWLLAGGIAYTFGTVFYHRPSMPHAHAIWHLFVIAGGACHFVAVLAQVTAPD